MPYVIQDLWWLSCQVQKSIRFKLEANPQAERRRMFRGEFPRVRFKSFLAHIAWQQKPQCDPKALCVQSSEADGKVHFIRALKSGFRYETIEFQVIQPLRKMPIIIRL